MYTGEQIDAVLLRASRAMLIISDRIQDNFLYLERDIYDELRFKQRDIYVLWKCLTDAKNYRDDYDTYDALINVLADKCADVDSYNPNYTTLNPNYQNISGNTPNPHPSDFVTLEEVQELLADYALLPDRILTGLEYSYSAPTATISAGTYKIGNVVYSASETGFPIAPCPADLLKKVRFYATTAGTILSVESTPASVVETPDIPDGTLGLYEILVNDAGVDGDVTADLSGFVTLSTPQTITAVKIFNNDVSIGLTEPTNTLTLSDIAIGTSNDVGIDFIGLNGVYSPVYGRISLGITDATASVGSGYLSLSTINLGVLSEALRVLSNKDLLTYGRFVKNGGTSLQFLKADGSLDESTYLTAAVTSLSGTLNQVSVSSSDGDVTLSLPQSIAQSSTPTFANLNIGNGIDNSQMVINGADSGTNGGSSFVLRNNGVSSFSMGNTSNIIGGSYDATPMIYGGGDIRINRVTDTKITIGATTVTFVDFPTITAGTIWRVPFFASGGKLTDNANLTFDGSNLSVATPTADAHAVNKGYADATYNRFEATLALSDLTSDLTTGTTKGYFRVTDLNGITLTRISASVLEAPVGSSIIFDIYENGVSILSTKLTIDAGEKTSVTAAVPYVISDAVLAFDSEVTFGITQIGSVTAGKAAEVFITGTRN